MLLRSLLRLTYEIACFLRWGKGANKENERGGNRKQHCDNDGKNEHSGRKANRKSWISLVYQLDGISSMVMRHPRSPPARPISYTPSVLPHADYEPFLDEHEEHLRLAADSIQARPSYTFASFYPLPTPPHTRLPHTESFVGVLCNLCCEVVSTGSFESHLKGHQSPLKRRRPRYEDKGRPYCRFCQRYYCSYHYLVRHCLHKHGISIADAGLSPVSAGYNPPKAKGQEDSLSGLGESNSEGPTPSEIGSELYAPNARCSSFSGALIEPFSVARENQMDSNVSSLSGYNCHAEETTLKSPEDIDSEITNFLRMNFDFSNADITSAFDTDLGACLSIGFREEGLADQVENCLSRCNLQLPNYSSEVAAKDETLTSQLNLLETEENRNETAIVTESNNSILSKGKLDQSFESEISPKTVGNVQPLETNEYHINCNNSYFGTDSYTGNLALTNESHAINFGFHAGNSSPGNESCNPSPTSKSYVGNLTPTKSHTGIPSPTNEFLPGIPSPTSKSHVGSLSPTGEAHPGIPSPTSDSYGVPNLFEIYKTLLYKPNDEQEMNELPNATVLESTATKNDIEFVTNNDNRTYTDLTCNGSEALSEQVTEHCNNDINGGKTMESRQRRRKNRKSRKKRDKRTKKRGKSLRKIVEKANFNYMSGNVEKFIFPIQRSKVRKNIPGKILKKKMRNYIKCVPLSLMKSYY